MSAVPIEVVDGTIIQLAHDLNDTMKVEFGAGLAATQIGVKKAVVVISGAYSSPLTLDNDPLLSEVIVLVNPHIEVLNDQMFEWEEACLSVPDYSAHVKRHTDIRLTYQNLSGNTIVRELSAPFSGIVQHEADHLEGKLYLDRLTSSKKKKAQDILRGRIKKARTEAEKTKKKARTRPEKPEIRKGFRTKSTTSLPRRKKRPKKTHGKNKKKRR